MSLPEMNGEEVGRKIAADPELRGTQQILMTYPGQRFDPGSIRRIGFDAYVWKPILEPRLAEAVSRVLAGRNREFLDRAGEASPQRRRAGQKRILVVEDDPACREVAIVHRRRSWAMKQTPVQEWGGGPDSFAEHGLRLPF